MNVRGDPGPRLNAGRIWACTPQIAEGTENAESEAGGGFIV